MNAEACLRSGLIEQPEEHRAILADRCELVDRIGVPFEVVHRKRRLRAGQDGKRLRAPDDN